MKADSHPLQDERLDALRRYGILDTPRECEYDEIVALVAKLCGAPIAVVNFVDEKRQWFKAEVGLGVRETPLDTSICAHVILEDDFVEISDTLQDRRLIDNPLCFGEQSFRFYAGALLKTSDGLPLGTLCVLDYVPRALTETQREVLSVFSKQLMKLLELRRSLRLQYVFRQEIYHRVGNSLATVAALVRMKNQQINDPRLSGSLRAIEGRIYTIAHLHRELCQSEMSEVINLKSFMSRIGTHLCEIAPPNVDLDIRFDEVTVTSHQASSIAIIINEFIANSNKHAFPDGKSGSVKVDGVVDNEGYIRLTCWDDGVGGDNANSSKSEDGIGTLIIDASATQLGGHFRMGSTEKGYFFELYFNPNGPTSADKASCIRIDRRRTPRAAAPA